MIVDVLANSERIEGLNPYFKVVFDYIKTHDLSSMPVGRIDIDGDNAYLKIEDAKGRKTEEAVYVMPCMNGMTNISIFKCL